MICIGPLVDPVPLPSGHAYCRECSGGGRTKGESQTCPLCRAELPPGVEGLFDLATRAYRRGAGRVRRGEAVWEAREGESAEEMEEAVAMLTEAVAQGHVGAMGLLAEVYEGGHEVERDEAVEEVEEMASHELATAPPPARHARSMCPAKRRLAHRAQA